MLKLNNRYFEDKISDFSVDCSFPEESYHDEFFYVDNVITIRKVKDPDKQKIIDSYKDQTDISKIVAMLIQTGNIESLSMPDGNGVVDFVGVSNNLEDVLKNPDRINEIKDTLPNELKDLPIEEILLNSDKYLKKQEEINNKGDDNQNE